MKSHVHHRHVIYLCVGMTLFGLIMIGNASSVTAHRDFGDKWHYFKLQAVWASIAFVGFALASRVSLHLLERLSVPLFIGTLGLLILVLIPGMGNKALGARRWLNLGPLSFQPAELAKLTVSIYLASLFKTKPGFLQFALVSGTVTGLVLLEPDMGTAVAILGICLLTYIGSGGSLRPLFGAAPIAILLGVALIFISPYRTARLKTFLDPSQDPLGVSYQVRQALISLGSGGLIGVGVGQSRQKYDFLPEATTDSIFAVIGEETGFLGALALTLSFLGLTLAGLKIASRAVSRFPAVLSLAISSWFGMQAFINISANTALLPYTGIPLPFVSYGGTALLVNLAAAGLLVNVARLPSTKP